MRKINYVTGFLSLLIFSLVILLSFTILDKKLTYDQTLLTVPGTKNSTPQPFGQFTYTPINPVWDRENTFINFSMYEREGDGPDLNAFSYIKVSPMAHPIKILLFGDSFIWGDGTTDNNKLLAMILQEQLNNRTKPGAFQVISYGHSGASTFNHLDYLTKDKVNKLGFDYSVYAYYVNDTIPNFNEKLICGDKATCSHSPQTMPSYQRCIKGESAPLNLFIANILRNGYPSLANTLLVRYCDPLYQRLKSITFDEAKLWNNPNLNPWFPTWIKAMGLLAENLGSKPHYLAQLYYTPVSPLSDKLVHQVVRNVGFKDINMGNTLNYEKNNPATYTYAVNPGNNHANSVLNNLYAEDIANRLLKDIPARVIDSVKQVIQAPDNLYATGLPQQLIVKSNSPKSFILTLPEKSKMTTFPDLVAGKPLPPQYVACADLGYSHIQINLGRNLHQGSRLKISLLSSNDNNLILGYYSYDKFLVRSFHEVGPLKEIRFITVPTDYGTELVVGDKGKNEGCALNQEIALPSFSLKVSLGD